MQTHEQIYLGREHRINHQVDEDNPLLGNALFHQDFDGLDRGTASS